MAPVGGPKDQPWADRHRPKHLGQVVGNTDQVRKLAEWLRDWDDVVLRGKVKEVAPQEAWKSFQPAAENINARCALVSGPPGIGKTTTCCLVARCLARYNLMEFNASDARSKSIIDQMSKSLAGNHTLKMGLGGGTLQRTVIIMDECDGMAGGGDSGGMQALINMIKVTKNPIICICNDRQDRQVRELATVCLDIKFKRPGSAVVAKRVKAILEGEGKRADANTIEAVVEACNGDIRQVINHTQFFGSAAAHGKSCQKDTQVMLSPFDACAKLLCVGEKEVKHPIPMEQKMDMFYIDPDLMPVMIQENYLRPLEKRGSGSDLERCAQAAEIIALGDSMHGNWEVMGSQAVLSSIYPAFLTAGPDFARATFPAWLQKRAPMVKAARVVQELHARIKPWTSCSARELVTSSYHDLLHRRLLKPLLLHGAAKECAAALVAYGLTRDFFTEQAPVLRTTLHMEDGYKKVDPKVKTQLLQELQALADRSKQDFSKRTRKADGAEGPARKRLRGGEERGGDPGEDAPGEDDGEQDETGLAKKATGKKATGKKAREDYVVSKTSLKTWMPSLDKPPQAQDANGQDVPDRPPLMLLRFIDGHTCSVKRRVHLKDFLAPWASF